MERLQVQLVPFGAETARFDILAQSKKQSTCLGTYLQFTLAVHAFWQPRIIFSRSFREG